MSIFNIFNLIVSAVALIIVVVSIIVIIRSRKNTDKNKKVPRLAAAVSAIAATAVCWSVTVFSFYMLDADKACTVMFDTDGGSGIHDVIIDKGEMLNAPSCPVKEGYSFIGWYEDKDFNKRFDFFSPVERSCTLYARWLDVSSEAADIDGDGLTDESEKILGTDASSADSDNDGLSDSAETSVLGTDPLNADTDGNGISDADEDLDGDGIINKDEIDAKTDPCLSDTDGDGLDDKQEIETTKTDPLEKDTDKDGADDGWEKENSFDPLTYNDNFEIRVQSEASDGNVVTAFAEVNENGKTASSVQISEISSQDPLLNPQIPGYLGPAYEFISDGEISKAKISFQFNTFLGAVSDNFKPAIYYFDEESGAFEELEDQSISDDVVSAEVTHFSKYILLNKPEFDRVWSRGATISESADNSDSNNDGISDYYSELIFSGDLVLSNGSKELCGIDFNYNVDGDKSDDYDGDGVKNGDEISIVSKGGRTYISLRSDPTSSDTDGDGLSDAKDKSPLKWDISDRNLAMFCSMSYVLPYDYTFKFPVMLKDLPDQLKVKLNGEFNEFGNVASIEELYGWELISTIDKGFQAAAFRIDDNIVVAFTGTQGFDDWINDISEGLVGHSPQPKFASAYLSTLMLNYPDCNFYITGHSLGGNLAYHAAYQGLKLDKERIKGIVTFNGLGLPVSAAVTNRETFKDESRVLSDNTSIIKDYRVHGDWVSDVLVGFVTVHYGGDPIYYDKSSDIPKDTLSKKIPAILANNLGFVGKDIANIDWNCHKLYTFLQNLEPKGHISSVYAKSPDVPVLSGAVLNVFDEDGEKYGNYHLTISTLSGSYNYLKPKTVVDEDINSADGYTLDLDEGTYLISVKDIGKKASKTEYKTSVKIIGAYIKNKYYGLKSVEVYTDFGAVKQADKELKMVDYIGKAISDIGDMYGNDYLILDNSQKGGIDADYSIVYNDGRAPFTFGVDSKNVPDRESIITWVTYYAYEQPKADINGTFQSDVTYGELSQKTDGIHWQDSLEDIFLYTIIDNNVYITFIYDGLPDDNSTAYDVIVTKYKQEYITDLGEDWGDNFYNVLYEYLKSWESKSDLIHAFCSYAYVDIDNDGENELIIEDGTCEQDRTHHVYKMINGKAKLLGEYNAWHLALYNDNGTIVGISSGAGMEGKYNLYELKTDGQSVNMVKVGVKSGQHGYSNPIEFTDLYKK